MVECVWLSRPIIILVSMKRPRSNIDLGRFRLELLMQKADRSRRSRTERRVQQRVGIVCASIVELQECRAAGVVEVHERDRRADDDFVDIVGPVIDRVTATLASTIELRL